MANFRNAVRKHTTGLFPPPFTTRGYTSSEEESCSKDVFCRSRSICGLPEIQWRTAKRTTAIFRLVCAGENEVSATQLLNFQSPAAQNLSQGRSPTPPLAHAGAQRCQNAAFPIACVLDGRVHLKPRLSLCMRARTRKLTRSPLTI